MWSQAIGKNYYNVSLVIMTDKDGINNHNNNIVDHMITVLYQIYRNY